MVLFPVVLNNGFTETVVEVIRLSQPDAYLTVSLYVPLFETTIPDGNVNMLPAQIAVAEVLRISDRMDRVVLVIKLSQPDTYLRVSLYVPARVTLTPEGNKKLWPAQIEAAVTFLRTASTRKVTLVKMLSQPLAFRKVSL